MSEQVVRSRGGAIQDTGNYVLDTTVNLIMNFPVAANFSPEAIREYYETIEQLYLHELERDRGKRKSLKASPNLRSDAPGIGKVVRDIDAPFAHRREPLNQKLQASVSQDVKFSVRERT